MLLQFYRVTLIFSAFIINLTLSVVFEYGYDNFPVEKVALHMPCEESNMFATKCMCHIICSDPKCENAKSLCEKYQKSKGCKYMLVRKVGKSIVATLKRTPTESEMRSFNISMYPMQNAEVNRTYWSKQYISSKKDSKITIATLLNNDINAADVVNRLFQSRNTSSQYCNTFKEDIEQRVQTTTLPNISKAAFMNKSFAIVALSYQAPMTFVNSLRSWKSSGLLDMMNERVALLNDPLPQEQAMALQHGFEVLQPKDIPNVKSAKENVVTIGAAFYYALQHITSEYLIFLENDFKIDTTLTIKEIQAELIAAAGMLNNGAEVVRLMSRKYQGCGTFKTCSHHGIHLKAKLSSDRRRNWYAFYCRGHPESDPYVSDCFKSPDYRCFTSWDSNWSLNAVMVKKSTMLRDKKYITAKDQLPKSIAEIGLSQHQRQDGFETFMLSHWQAWRVPICISYKGLFIHEEIETTK